MSSRSSSEPLEILRARARLLASVRRFFAERGVLEVETPLLGHTATADPHIAAIAVPVEPGTAYLQTSPEFAMKRLLAAGSGAIYQICKAFRGGERGSRHSVEFTMLEWYRPGLALAELAAEVCDLVRGVAGVRGFHEGTYGSAFRDATGLDPHNASIEELVAHIRRKPSLARFPLSSASARIARGEALDLIFAHEVEPRLTEPLVLFDYPACQAALARVERDAHGTPVARRFEVYLKGMELANGYDELLDAAELRRRFDEDNEDRRLLGRPPMPPDEELLAAMERGLPACSGVALGLDRLLMIVTGAASIGEVIIPNGV